MDSYRMKQEMGMMLAGLNRYKQPGVLHVTVYIQRAKQTGQTYSRPRP
jgi:hypothetical protein